MHDAHTYIRPPPSSRGSNSPAIRFGANSQATGDPGNERNDYRAEVPEQHLSRSTRDGPIMLVQRCVLCHCVQIKQSDRRRQAGNVLLVTLPCLLVLRVSVCVCVSLCVCQFLCFCVCKFVRYFACVSLCVCPCVSFCVLCRSSINLTWMLLTVCKMLDELYIS